MTEFDQDEIINNIWHMVGCTNEILRNISTDGVTATTFGIILHHTAQNKLYDELVTVLKYIRLDIIYLLVDFFQNEIFLLREKNIHLTLKD